VGCVAWRHGPRECGWLSLGIGCGLSTRRALIARAGLLGTLTAAGSLVDASLSAAACTGVEIDVADFGTLGTSDDSATFQAALDAVPPGGAQVVAPTVTACPT
jgi:polygalacturonase